jgi:hypothetical protein
VQSTVAGTGDQDLNIYFCGTQSNPEHSLSLGNSEFCLADCVEKFCFYVLILWIHEEYVVGGQRREWVAETKESSFLVTSKEIIKVFSSAKITSLSRIESTAGLFKKVYLSIHYEYFLVVLVI